MKSCSNFARSTTAFVLLIALSIPVLAQTVDPDFQATIVLREGHTEIIRKAAKNKVYVAGDFDFHRSDKIEPLVRLTANGYWDSSFRPDLPDKSMGSVYKFEVLPNGNLVVIWQNFIVGGTHVFVLAVDGRRIAELDVDFPYAIAALPDNGFLLGLYDGQIVKITKALRVDETFQCQAYETVYDIALQGSKILVSGNFPFVYNWFTGNTFQRKFIARYHADGSVDTTFNANTAVDKYGQVPGMLVQPDGKIILLNHYRYSSAPKPAIRLHVDGAEDTSFKPMASDGNTIQDAMNVADKVVVATNKKIFRISYSGSLDTAFQTVTSNDNVLRTEVLEDNTIVVGNYDKTLYGFAKFNSTGAIIDIYNGQLTRFGEIKSVHKTTSSIYIGGDFIKVNDHFTYDVARLNPNGTVLKKFKVGQNKGVVEQVRGFENAKALVIGSRGLQRLEHDGRIDPSFYYNPNGRPALEKFVLQPDGKILVGGGFNLYRLNANGSFDNSFSTEGGNSTGNGTLNFAFDESTGKILFAYYYSKGFQQDFHKFVRLHIDGSVDETFSPAASAGYGLWDMVLVDGGQVILTTFNNVVKYNVDGTTNTEFAGNYHFHNIDYGPEQLHRFGHRIIASEYNFYGNVIQQDAFFFNGEINPYFEYRDGIIVRSLHDIFSEIATEFFIAGNAETTDGTRYQLLKMIYNGDLPADDNAGFASAQVELSFYPNPVSGKIRVKAPKNSEVFIYDLVGSMRMNTTLIEDEGELDLSALPAGRYLINVFAGDKLLQSQLVKE